MSLINKVVLLPRRLASLSLTLKLFLLGWVVLVVMPLAIIVAFSFLSVKYYKIVWTPSLDTWSSLFATGRWEIVLTTLVFAASLTAIELVLALPFATWLAGSRISSFKRAIIIAMLTVPFFLDPSTRVIVWRSILGNSGIVNTLLIDIGMVDQPVSWLLYTPFSVYLGMIGPYFPGMVLPIYMAISLIDKEYVHASDDLGASPLQTFVNIILPLAVPGIVTGVVFTFVPLMAAFVEPQMLGGGFFNLLGDSIGQALQQLKYPTAAGLSTIVLAILFILLFAFGQLSKRTGGTQSLFQSMKR